MNIRNTRHSDDFREVANRWVALDDAARMLEETKTAVLAQRCNALGDMPVTRAEQIVKSSKEWDDYLRKMVNARTQANKAKVEMEYYRMRFAEWNSDAATERAEARLRA